MFLTKLIDPIRKYALIVPLIGLVVSSSIAMIQSFRVSRYQTKIENLSETVAAYEEAAILMEDLQRKNRQLVRDRDDLLERIQDAEGHDTPVPPGILDLLERMH